MVKLVSSAARSDIGAGIAIALLSLTYALSYGALLFTSPLLIPYIGYSMSASLVTTIVTVFAVAYFSGIRFSIAGPDSNSVAVLTSLVFLISQTLHDTGITGEALAISTLSAMVIITLLTGLVLFLLGYFKVGSLVRFIPISVAGGFLAAAGCLMMSGAILLATGVNPMDLPDLGSITYLEWNKFATVVILAGIYWYVTSNVGSTMALPIAIFASIAMAHAAFYIQGISLTEAQEMGLLFDVKGEAALFFPLTDGNFDAIMFSTLLQYLPELAAMIIVVGIAILLIVAGIELDQNFDSDLNYELKGHGYANVLSAFFGGYMGLVSLSRTLLNAQKKSRFPVGALLTAILCGLVFWLGGELISVLPQISLAAMVLFLGAQIASRWMIETYTTLDRIEWAMILVIAVTTLAAGFLFGLGLGIVAGCMLFAARASIVSVVRAELSGEAYRSRVVRSSDEEVFLDDVHKSIRIYELQGFLFFGTAHNFYTLIKDELENPDSSIKHLILSFKHVSGIDASAEQILQKIFLAADKQNCSLSTIELPQSEQLSLARLLRRSPALIADQNYAAIYDAMESIEESMLRAREFNMMSSLQRWLETRVDNPKIADHLFEALEQRNYEDGEVICHQGEEADEIFFLDTGRIDVVSHDVPGQPFRIYSYMRHTMLGEMGFVRQETRSADLIARGPTTVYALSRDKYNKLEAAHDPAVDALLQLVSVTLSDRIISANRTIAELQS